MKAARAIVLTTLAIVCMMYAYELCFEDTTFGGWLPFLTLGLSPVLGFMLGLVGSGTKRH